MPLRTLRVSRCIKCLQELLLLQISCRIYKFFPESSPSLLPCDSHQRSKRRSQKRNLRTAPAPVSQSFAFSSEQNCFFWLMFCFVLFFNWLQNVMPAPVSPYYDFSSSRRQVSYANRLLGERPPPFRSHAQTCLSPGDRHSLHVPRPPLHHAVHFTEQFTYVIASDSQYDSQMEAGQIDLTPFYRPKHGLIQVHTAT